MPLLGADPINRAYHGLVGNTDAIPGMLFLLFFGAGFGEETLYRGWLFERLGRALGSSPGAKVAIVVLTSLLFGLVHYHDQGLAGAEQGTITGLVVGGIFAATGRIWLPMILHVAFDLTALAIIYSNLEAKVAHWIFR
jgi:membrane protease YdiL (CAAX protease family)